MDQRCLHSSCISLCEFAHNVLEYKPAVDVHLTLWYIVLVCHLDVNIILAVCMLVGIVVSAKVGSVSLVNCVQSAFLSLVKLRRFCCSL